MAGQGGARSRVWRLQLSLWLWPRLRLRRPAAAMAAALASAGLLLGLALPPVWAVGEMALPAVQAAVAGGAAGRAPESASGPAVRTRPGPFAEVASGHWTYLDLSVLSSADLLPQQPFLLTPGYTLTRFEVALLLSGALDRVLKDQAGSAAEERGGSGPVLVVREGKTFSLNLKPAVIGAMGRLLREYWPELEVLGWRMGEIPVQVPPAFRFCDLDEVTKAEAPSPGLRLQLYPVGTPLAALSPDPESLPAGQKQPASLVILRETKFGGDPGHYFYLLGDGLAFDSRLQLPLTLDGQKMALLGGEFQVSDDLKISGEVARPAAPGNQKGGAARVGAAVNLGQVEVGADLHRVEPGSAPLLRAEEGASLSTGYGFFLRFGRVTVRTGLDLLKPPVDTASGPTTGMGSGGAAAGTQVLTAGAAPGGGAAAAGEVRLVDLDRVSTGEIKPQGASTTLGVDVQLTQEASVQAGISITRPLENASGGSGDSPFLRFDGKKATAGLKLRLNNGAVLAANLGYAQKELTGGRETSTSVGVSHSLSPGASLLFNYRLINFGPEGAGASQTAESAATAEIALHF